MNDEQPKVEVSPESSPSGGRLKIVLAVMAVCLVIMIGYAAVQQRAARETAASRDALTATLALTRSQVGDLTAKLNSMTAANEAAAAAATPADTVASRPKPKAQNRSGKRAAAKRVPAHDPRWGQVQSELAEQQKQISQQQKDIADHQRLIQETQDNLTKARTDLESSLSSTRDELGGSIARTHEELVALQKKGERNYYEFDLPKSKQFHHEGSISISLRKTNTKHDFCDLEAIVEDAEISKKHVSLFEPVMFYPEGYSQPLELVINRISKDAIHGYVSEPKYKPAELTTNSSGNAPSPSSSLNLPTQSSGTGSLEHRPALQQ